MLMTGKILRFDEVRGYGFIIPDEGGEDVFMHANDLLGEKYLYRAGREVEFFVEDGDKGPKASEIRLVHRSTSRPVVRDEEGESRPVQRDEQSGDDALCDVLSLPELRSELTEALLGADGSLTAEQIRRVRQRVLELAQAHGWTES
ncbi:cold shock domain-containing protein [Streptomyces sp. AJS327]|uniref:cold-shock protein n=1 Tax=Streptomyces sp. AJS327 TaxID=2545265 RepID=UPI0015DEBF66|nr:cold shock domain-containing protein [Streptomyces sp. AJS327]MBA0052336.1 cold shock domain-containing protein [Streptomyces sp. AJS327]